jgi:hypothetical protein
LDFYNWCHRKHALGRGSFCFNDITGHKIHSVFDRYHIVSVSDIADAARKVEANQERAAPPRTKSGVSKFRVEIVAELHQTWEMLDQRVLPFPFVTSFSFCGVGLVPGGGVETRKSRSAKSPHPNILSPPLEPGKSPPNAGVPKYSF